MLLIRSPVAFSLACSTSAQRRTKLALRSTILAALGFVIFAPQAAAQAEAVIVTRKIADLYGVKGDDVLLMTAGCDVYALASPARLQPESGRMVLRFDGTAPGDDQKKSQGGGKTDDSPACELRDMLKPQPVPRGRYQVKLSYDSADWYLIEGTNLLLRTLGCQRRSAREPVVWFQPQEGKGVIEFRSGVACTSDGVFGSVRRQARGNAVAHGR